MCLMGVSYTLHRREVRKYQVMFISDASDRYARYTVNGLNEFLVKMPEHVRNCSALLDMKIKMTVDCAQSVRNFFFMHFRLFIVPSHWWNAHKKVSVNNKHIDRVITKLRDFYFPG